MTANNDSAGTEDSSPDMHRFANNDVAYTLSDFSEGSEVAVVEARGAYYKITTGVLKEDMNEHGFMLEDAEKVADLIESKRDAKQQAKEIISARAGDQNE